MSWENWIRYSEIGSYDYLDMVKHIIKTNKLDEKDRTRHKVYGRYILYYKLRRRGYTLSFIGDLFGLDHSTITYGLKSYHRLKGYPDFKELENRYNKKLI